jgi:hypothetical protein
MCEDTIAADWRNLRSWGLFGWDESDEDEMNDGSGKSTHPRWSQRTFQGYVDIV